MDGKTKFFRLVLFFIIMGYVSQWTVINLYFTSLGQKRELITDLPLLGVVKEKTGLTLESFRLIASPRLYAVMIGIPGKPYMLISNRLHQEFTDSEKEYVVLHEAGHYLLHHGLKEVVFFVILFTLGILIVRKKSFYMMILIGIFLGLVNIWYSRTHEYEADRFTAQRMTDPRGMITATEKFRLSHNPPLNDSGFIWKIFIRSTPYKDRVVMAEEEIKN